MVCREWVHVRAAVNSECTNDRFLYSTLRIPDAIRLSCVRPVTAADSSSALGKPAAIQCANRTRFCSSESRSTTKTGMEWCQQDEDSDEVQDEDPGEVHAAAVTLGGAAG